MEKKKNKKTKNKQKNEWMVRKAWDDANIDFKFSMKTVV